MYIKFQFSFFSFCFGKANNPTYRQMNIYPRKYRNPYLMRASRGFDYSISSKYLII